MKKNHVEKAGKIREALEKLYPEPKTSLGNWKTPAQFITAVVLSAQCTDARVNIVTKELFTKYKTSRDFARAGKKLFEKEIRSTGFYRNKAKNIINCHKKILQDFGGNVPRTMEELLSLPGVARKTANVVLNTLHNRNDGFVVDTHVKRVAFRLGLTENKNPEKIEKDLMQVVPKQKWGSFSLQLIFHGRKICSAKKPYCSECALNKLCSSAFREKGWH